jgi:putative ABC transport system substrate-binding protein
MRRREFITLVGGAAAAWPLAARAQQAGKVPRIGFLGTASPSTFTSRLEGFRQGLRDVGYVEGGTIAVEYRWAEGRYERLPELAADLVRSNPDVIVTHTTPASLAAKKATTTIPIVMALVGDPVAAGIVESVAKPGGNITGQSFFNAELRAKRIELLKEVMPRLARAAVIMNADNPAAELEFRAMEAAAKSLNIELQPFRLRSPGELAGAFGEMEKRQVEAIETGDDQISTGNIGGTMGYGIDVGATYRRTAVFVDKILKGAKPADLPIERASKFQFILNLKSAKALGLEVPAGPLLRADEVIE